MIFDWQYVVHFKLSYIIFIAIEFINEVTPRKSQDLDWLFLISINSFYGE